MIEELTVKAYYSESAKRRFFSRSGAINAEARETIYKYFPKIAESNEYEGSYCTYAGENYDIAEESPEYFSRRHAQLCRGIRSRMRREKIKRVSDNAKDILFNQGDSK